MVLIVQSVDFGLESIYLGESLCDFVRAGLEVVLHSVDVFNLLIDLGLMSVDKLCLSIDLLSQVSDLLVFSFNNLILLLKLSLELKHELSALLQSSLVFATLTLLSVSHLLELAKFGPLFVKLAISLTELKSCSTMLLFQLVELPL